MKLTAPPPAIDEPPVMTTFVADVTVTDETAEIAVQSALTGHLVLSTLHTNDAPGTIAPATPRPGARRRPSVSADSA